MWLIYLIIDLLEGFVPLEKLGHEGKLWAEEVFRLLW